MNRIDRLNAILIQLQGKKIVKAAEIAERFNISLRTVYRDVKALQESGVPIGAEAGTGYYIVEGYHLPPVMFSKEEAAALLTGEKLMAQLGDQSNQKQFSIAMQKIRAVLRGTEKDYLESLDENIAVIAGRAIHTNTEFPNKFSSDVQYAIAHGRIVNMVYYSSYNGSQNERNVAPIGVFYLSGCWHMIAYCLLRNDYRDFRLDRIKQLMVSDKTFNRKNYMTFSEYLAKQQQMPESSHLIKLILTPRIARIMRDQRMHYGMVEEIVLPDGNSEFHFLHGSLEYFGRWLLPWGKGATVVFPEELKIVMKRLVSEIHDHYMNS
ncbi:transcriptional regulator [Chitinophaga caeni]|uniref:Transcriptional regulator n=1 Tax=Chitinophaga caeni TaxID=2029983 RepID=A0A291QSY0_9BACT|nr:YafY family protein [Chitinophaga caeni]ATL46954.1 transcriptional regulator [Chitinophaga caeni]